MSVMPSAANAASFQTAATPDAQQDNLPDLLQKVLAILSTRPPDQSEMMALRAFEEAKQQIFMQYVGGGQAGDQGDGSDAEQQPMQPSGAGLNGPTSQYGTASDTSSYQSGF